MARLVDVQQGVETAAVTEPPAANPQPRLRTAIAVLMSHFPRIDDTFILREIDELERNGQPVVVVPLVQNHARIVHEEAKRWMSRALFLPLLSLPILASNVATFLRAPLTYLKLLITLIGGTMWRPSTLLRTVALFPKSVHLARVLTNMGVKHVHSHYASHATTMAYIIATLSDITYSFTVHGPDVFVHRLLLAEKIRKASFIRCISVFNKAFLAGLYPHLSEGKVFVARTGLNPEVYEEAAARSDPHGTTVRLLTVAALTPNRGYPVLIDACARLVEAGFDLECQIVGDGPLRAVTEQWIAKHGLTERVRILGVLPQHEVARLMGEADIFVMPSIIATDGQMDGVPVSLMEAMAAGKAVIASGISGIPELVKHDVNGILVDAAYPQRIAAALRRLLEDPSLRERLGRAARQTIREQFDIRRTAPTLVRRFDDLAEANEASTPTRDRILGLNWNRMNATALGVRRVHERPTSYVAEVTINDGTTKQEVIVRRHCGTDAADLARTEFEALTTLRQSFADATVDGTICSVPRLLMFDEPNSAIVAERADGRSLAGTISDGNTKKIAEALRHAGTWLRVLQERTPRDEDGRHVVTGIVLLALRDADLAAAGERSLRRHHGAIRARLQSLESYLTDRQLRVVGHHGRFWPENIFIGGERVDVVDFPEYRDGLPLEDVAELLLQLELRFAGTLLRAHEEALRGAFIEAYAGADAELDYEALQLFTMTRALQLLARGGATRAQRRTLRRIIVRSLA